jgi:hypothetical protein
MPHGTSEDAPHGHLCQTEFDLGKLRRKNSAKRKSDLALRRRTRSSLSRIISEVKLVPAASSCAALQVFTCRASCCVWNVPQGCEHKPFETAPRIELGSKLMNCAADGRIAFLQNAPTRHTVLSRQIVEVGSSPNSPPAGSHRLADSSTTLPLNIAFLSQASSAVEMFWSLKVPVWLTYENRLRVLPHSPLFSTLHAPP